MHKIVSRPTSLHHKSDGSGFNSGDKVRSTKPSVPPSWIDKLAAISVQKIAEFERSAIRRLAAGMAHTCHGLVSSYLHWQIWQFDWMTTHEISSRFNFSQRVVISAERKFDCVWKWFCCRSFGVNSPNDGKIFLLLSKKSQNFDSWYSWVHKIFNNIKISEKLLVSHKSFKRLPAKPRALFSYLTYCSYISIIRSMNSKVC